MLTCGAVLPNKTNFYRILSEGYRIERTSLRPEVRFERLRQSGRELPPKEETSRLVQPEASSHSLRRTLSSELASDKLY